MTECNHPDQVAAFTQAAKPPESSSAPDGWIFRISRDEALTQLEQLDGRAVTPYSDQVVWVSANLNNRNATPETAPCNASWNLLAWASVNQKDFFTLQRQALAKKDEPDAPQGQVSAEDEADCRKMFDLVNAFGCFREAEKREGID